MLSAYKSTKANRNLKAIMKSYRDNYESLCDSSRKDYIQTLGAGSRVPAEGRLYTDAAREDFAEKCRSYRSEVRSIIDDALSDLKAESTKAPDADAVNVVSLLKTRSNVSEQEIDDLLTRYGKDCPQIWRAIKDIAASNKHYYVPDHPVDAVINDISDLGSSIDRALMPPLSNAAATPSGVFSMIGLTVDAVFPADSLYDGININ